LERNVKGTIMKVIVKGIKSDKTNVQLYDDVLSDDAKELLNTRILDSVWYSHDTFIELYRALAQFFANNSPEIIVSWGQDFGQAIMTSIYKNIVIKGDLDKLIKKYQNFHRLMYNFGDFTIEKVSENEILLTYRNFDSKFEIWYFTSIGWMQKSVEMCIKKKVEYEILKRSWKGDQVTQYKLSWSS